MPTKRIPFQQTLVEQFDCHIESACGPVHVCGYEFNAAMVLKRMSPASYQHELQIWLDGEVSDGRLVKVKNAYHTVTPTRTGDRN